jgi:hypothetical protein
MTRHIRAEALARYREGDLGSRKAARIRAHLAGCARCAALDEDLAGVTSLLASAPAPPMPDQVTARIQAALMAEAARPAPAAAAARPGAHRPAAVPPGGRRSRHAAGRPAAGSRMRLPGLRPQLAARAVAATAVAAAIVGGIYGIRQLGSASESATSSSAGGLAAGPAAKVPAPQNGPAVRYTTSAGPASFTPISTGTNFQQQRLASQARAALRAGPRQPTRMGADATSGSLARPGPTAGAPSFGGMPVASLQGCVMRISAGRRVLLVDVDRYQGKPATIIVVAGADGGTGGSRVFVVGPACSGSDSDLITQASLAGGG